MIGPYYRPQMTSILSITHRASGIFLSLVALPLMLWWLVALASGAEAYGAFQQFLSGWFGRLVLLGSILCLFYHLFNGIRHLVWDTGRGLDIRSAYSMGWMVLIATVVASAALLGVLS
jgi:succinate dehydrogenase / fumarate reductase cytochrome b subunit